MRFSINNRLSLVPLTGLVLLTLGGCASATNKNSASNQVTNSTVNVTVNSAGNTVSNAAGSTNSTASTTNNAANNVQVSVGSTPSSEKNYASEISLIKSKGYSVLRTTPNAVVKTSSGATLSAWLGVTGVDGHNQFVFFFLNGRYLGTDTAKPSVEITSAKASGDGIAVTYPVYNQNDSFADPTGLPVTITYTWNGSKLVPNKPYPKQFQAKSAKAQSENATQPFNTLSVINSNTAWATGLKGVQLTQDGGVHWKNVSPRQLSNIKSPLMKVFGLNDKQAWLAVANNSNVHNPVSIFHTSNGGQTWSKQKFSDVGDPITLHFRDSNHGSIALMQGAAAGSEKETIYDTNNGGTTWNKVGVASSRGGSLPFGGDKTGASFLNDSRGWATGFTPVNGHVYLYQTTNGGKAWKAQHVTVPSQLRNGQFMSYPPVFFGQQKGLLAVNDGSTFLVYRTTNGGQTWLFGKPIHRTSQNETLRAWSFSTFSDGVATDGKKMFTTTNSGQTWSSFTPNISLQNVSKLKFTSSSSGWAVMNSGVIYHTADGGHTWKKS